jgi:hypothetical protein
MGEKDAMLLLYCIVDAISCVCTIVNRAAFSSFYSTTHTIGQEKGPAEGLL